MALSSRYPAGAPTFAGVIRWLTGFLDIPAETFEPGARFWEAATGSTRSAARGDQLQFATLLPTDGDAFLRVQRVDSGSAGVHLDVHVADITAGVRRAVDLDASIVADCGYVVMASPAGFVFCLVGHHGESVRPSPFEAESEGPSLVDQLTIDVPAQHFLAEVAFWSALTGYQQCSAARAEFEVLVRPPTIPLKLLLQRLGDDDPHSTARGHLDVACGDHVAAVAARHCKLGARLERTETYWTTLRDPAGLAYCLTARDPVSGLLNA